MNSTTFTARDLADNLDAAGIIGIDALGKVRSTASGARIMITENDGEFTIYNLVSDATIRFSRVNLGVATAVAIAFLDA